MNALINNTKKVDCSLQDNTNTNTNTKQNKKESLINLLKDKIEKSIIDGKAIIIISKHFFMEYRNTLYVEDYEIDLFHLYLNENNFEAHIIFTDTTEIKYDNTYDESFVVTDKDSEITLIF